RRPTWPGSTQSAGKRLVSGPAPFPAGHRFRYDPEAHSHRHAPEDRVMTRIVSIPALALRVEGAPDDISAIYMAINQLFGFASQVATVQPTLALETATE